MRVDARATGPGSVADLMRQIDVGYAAVTRGLLEPTRHAWITARMERLASLHAQLEAAVGTEEATRPVLDGRFSRALPLRGRRNTVGTTAQADRTALPARLLPMTPPQAAGKQTRSRTNSGLVLERVGIPCGEILAVRVFAAWVMGHVARDHGGW
jgi:hypothetical protein